MSVQIQSDYANYYKHQIATIEKVVKSDFESGIICHATGTGKTVTALGIILQFSRKYPDSNIMWFSERKQVLVELRKQIQKYFPCLINHYHLVEYVNQKDRNWFENLNLIRKWGKPLFISINRAFLTSQMKYEKLTLPISLIIHDESHSGMANQTFAFLQEMKSRDAKIIGFSATPLNWTDFGTARIREIYPKLISLFHFKDAIIQKVILPPKLVWVNSLNKSDDKFSIAFWLPILDYLFRKQTDSDNIIPYRKMVVWSGTVEKCEKAALDFSKLKTNYPNLNKMTITIDTSKIKSELNSSSLKDIITYDEFKRKDSDAILFCAMKHREGSDIYHLDSCLFLDGVNNRTDCSLIQSFGRVLRRDKTLESENSSNDCQNTNSKKFGLIIDASATSFTYYYDYLNRYLLDMEKLLSKGWDNYLNKTIKPLEPDLTKIKNKDIETSICGLNLYDIQTITEMPKLRDLDKTDPGLQINSCLFDFKTKINPIKSVLSGEETEIELNEYFVRQIPNCDIYRNRLEFESRIITENNYTNYILQVVEILKLIGPTPKIIRGSCGSSLICYLLGITNIDPVKHDISFVRFLNSNRKTMPDIDMDFPYNKRAGIFQKIDKHWPGKVARISNHLYFREKSSLREAIRNLDETNENNLDSKFHHLRGLKNHDLQVQLAKLDTQHKQQLKEKSIELENTFRGYSLHCGGIVIFENGVPAELFLRSKKGNQIIYDKRDIQKHQHFKIDILSNRGLAILADIYPNKELDSYEMTNEICELLASGKNIGLTFAESPLMRRAFQLVKPKNLSDVAFCLAVIRPAFSNGLSELNSKESILEKIKTSDIPCYDDDVIRILNRQFDIDEEKADEIRRGFAKRDPDVMEKFIKTNLKKSSSKDKNLLSLLDRLNKYSFCKSHAISQAQLVIGLAHAKLNRPKCFWLSCLNHSQTSYRKWVHFREALLAGWELTLAKKPYYVSGNRILGKEIGDINCSNALDQVKTYGYWISPHFITGTYLNFNRDKTRAEFKGLIASHRTVHRKGIWKTYLTVGYENGCYIDINFNFGKSLGVNFSKHWICYGEGIYKNGCIYINKSITS